MSETLNPSLLLPVGKILLLGSIGVSTTLFIKGDQQLDKNIERILIAFLCMTFYREGADLITRLSVELTDAVRTLGHTDLRKFILESVKTNKAEGFLLQVEQAWRFGTWGVLNAIVDWLFLIITYLLKSAREVFWAVLLVLFPVSCGLFPIFPSMMKNLIRYGIELSLWTPLLSVIEVTTAKVAQHNVSKTFTGLIAVIAVELLSVLLIVMIPSMTHQFLSGGFSQDFGAQGHAFSLSKKALSFVNPTKFIKGGF